MKAPQQSQAGNAVSSLCQLFQQWVDEEFIKWAENEVGYKPRRGMFSTALIVWLMILQRLNPSHTLSRAVAELKSGKVDQLLRGEGKRVRQESISGNTGGYSKARSKLPLELVRLIAQHIFSSFSPAYSKRGCSLKPICKKVSGVDQACGSVPVEAVNAFFEKRQPNSRVVEQAHWRVVFQLFLMRHDLRL